MVSGAWPPDVCGVGEYTDRLCNSIESSGLEVKKIKLSFKKFFNELAFLPSNDIDIIHIQYPARGKGYSLFAPLFAILCRFFFINVIVTIHEYTQTHRIRKFLVFILSNFANHVIFTTDYERKRAPLLFKNAKSCVIPIGNNICFNDIETRRQKVSNSIVYFGLIRPNKGLEDFIRLTSLVSLNSYSFSIIGAVEDRFEDYKNLLKAQTGANVIWNLNHPEPIVKKLLLEADYAYLPFPDGATMRRTTLLACLKAGLNVFTTWSTSTEQELTGLVSFVSNVQECELLIKEHSKSANFIDKNSLLDDNRNRFLMQYDWKNVAAKHLAIYDKVMLLDV